jgi:DNA-binding MarR family transcriptional regulator
MKIRPEDSLGYWLFYAQRCAEYAFSEALRISCLEQKKPYVITPSQWGVLALLYDGDGLTIGTISQRRGLDAPTVTGIVKRLEQSGLVVRLHDRQDRRIVMVYLTDEGWDSMRFRSDTALAFSNIMTQGFSAVEQRDMLAKLQQIIANVSAVGPGTGDRFGLLSRQIHLEEESLPFGRGVIKKEGAL